MANAGLKLSIGCVENKIDLIDYSKLFEPLTLSCTLDAITKTLDQVKDVFKQSITDLQYYTAEMEYVREAQQIFVKVEDYGRNALTEITNLENMLLPLGKIKDIIALVDHMRDILYAVESEFLYEKNLVAQAKYDLYLYANATYKEAIAAFRQIQADFIAVKLAGRNIFNKYFV